ncbi:hypothetical protein EVAR_86615_1 [Eumeta japonica]|uniref:Uncharacterized protein n=1 Tax=Eumeta variegata TaxID=151549 RepID=A0A4C1W1U1_EUMVA|nr:hypothetical protein EVAR_86615_1 [Eumeta japonica]
MCFGTRGQRRRPCELAPAQRNPITNTPGGFSPFAQPEIGILRWLSGVAFAARYQRISRRYRPGVKPLCLAHAALGNSAYSRVLRGDAAPTRDCGG